MQAKNTEIWKTKLDWIVQQGGMVLMNTHPDYMHFGSGKCGNEEYPSHFYEEFLKYVQEKYAGQYWHALPKDVAKFWKRTYSMDWIQWKANVFPYYNAKILRDAGLASNKK
jgi:hypothetical protein